MGTNLSANYSGVVLNQNVPGTAFDWRSGYGGDWVYQTFYLPDDYARGDAAIPDLSGFQVLVTIDSGVALTVGLDYSLDVLTFGSGWHNLTNGTVVGAHADGQVWVDLLFPSSVPIPSSRLGSLFRIGVSTRTFSGSDLAPVDNVAGTSYTIGGEVFTVNLVENTPYPILVNGLPQYLLLSDTQVLYGTQVGVTTIWYTLPNPLSQHSYPAGLSTSDQGLARYPQAYQADGSTTLLDPGLAPAVSLNFRILALVADSGTDFLGNEYRSYVTQAAPANTSTIDGLHPVLGSGQGPAWMSPPLPSRFAVASMYFDMRPVPSTLSFGLSNLVNDPSFEWDTTLAAPAWWSSFVSGGTLTTFKVQKTWAQDGLQSLRITGTSMTLATVFAALFDGEEGTLRAQPSLLSPTVYAAGALSDAGYVEARGAATTINPGTTYTLQAVCNNLQGQPYVAINWLDTNAALIAQSLTMGDATAGLKSLVISDQAPPNAIQAVVVLGSNAVTTTVDSYWDAVMLTQTTSAVPYDDGDSPNWQWIGLAGDSVSVEVISAIISEGATPVIDGINIDPSTPNMAFNVYYSQDDAYTSSSMSERDWEQKLWTRVPRVFICTQAQTYALPDPIVAKYLKVEFTNLQAQPYDPGNFVLPILYKKHPTWVANFFMTQMEVAPFTAGQVNVQYDALDFAYNYYLDDLNQEPAAPVVAPSNAVAQLTSYFNSQNQQFQVDATTLAQINLEMNIYASPSASVASSGSVISGQAATVVNAQNANVTSEAQNIPAVDYSVVSSSSREAVVFEQALPVMYFFVTCRHSYQELSASLQFNRAYFAGVNSISFMRNNYTIAADTPMYIESGADGINLQRFDFTLGSDGAWYTY